MDTPILITRASIIAMFCVALSVLVSGCETTKTIQQCVYSEAEVLQTKQQAEAGDLVSQIRLAEWNKYGSCLPVNYPEAVIWHKRAVEQNHLDSQKELAYIYRFHLKDMNSAIIWYQKVADSGDIEAARTLGHIYNFGDGVERDIDKAEKWYTLAAERGDVSSVGRLDEILKKKNPTAWENEQQRIAEEFRKEKQRLSEERKRLSEERKRLALDRFGNIGIAWLPKDPEFLKEKSSVTTSSSEASDAEARGYLYAPIALVSWPAWLLTAVVGESGVAAKKSAEHTHIQNTVRKVFDESDIQTFFIDNLIEAANDQLDNPVTVLEYFEETKSYFDRNNVDTILELKNGLVKIVAKTNHIYDVLVEVEYKLIDTETQNVINQKTLKAWGGTFTVTRSSRAEGEEDIDTKFARRSLEVAYQKLANNIVESVLELP